MKNSRVRRLRNLRRRKGQCIYCGKNCTCGRKNETSKIHDGSNIKKGSSEACEVIEPGLECDKEYEDF